MATADTSTALDRLQAALADPAHLFTRDQVVYLMATAARWAREAVEDEPSPLTYAAGHAAGYAARVREENAAYPAGPIFDGRETVRWINQVDYRRRRDAEAPRRLRTDYRGGQLPAWPPDWCGNHLPHTPHVEEAAGCRFRCKGRDHDDRADHRVSGAVTGDLRDAFRGHRPQPGVRT